jgi:hypothetical protein
LTPRLLGPHLVIAGLIAVSVALFLPAMVAVAGGYGGSPLPVIAFALTAFSFAAFLMHWQPAAMLILFYAPSLLIYGASGLALSLSVKSSLAIALSVAGLASIVLRFRNFNEEIPEFKRRLPRIGFGWSSFQATPGQTFSPWSLWNPVPPIRRNLRALTMPYPVWDETLWRRAVHWDAAWQNFRRVVYLSLWVALSFFAFALYSRTSHSEGPPRPAILMFPLVLISQFAATPLWGTMYWNHNSLVGEFLRPYSRPQHVRAVGFVLAVACATSFMLASAALLASISIFGLPTPSADRVIRELVFAASSLPLFFAVTVWPFPASSWRLGNYIYSLVVLVPTMFLWDMVYSLANGPFIVGALLMGFAGCVATWKAYRRWLIGDVV